MFNQNNDPFTGDDIADHLEEMAEKAGRYLRQILDENPSWQKGAETLATTIREEPIKASLITLGIGLVLGHIFRRH